MKLFLVLFVILMIQFGRAQTKPQTGNYCEIEVPNAWSVNMEDDGKWRIAPDCPVTQFSVVIYNRWGNKLYTQDTLKEDNCINWDFKNPKIESGVYFYVIDYKARLGKMIIEKQKYGNFTINK